MTGKVNEPYSSSVGTKKFSYRRENVVCLRTTLVVTPELHQTQIARMCKPDVFFLKWTEFNFPQMCLNGNKHYHSYLHPCLLCHPPPPPPQLVFFLRGVGHFPVICCFVMEKATMLLGGYIFQFAYKWLASLLVTISVSPQGCPQTTYF